MSQIPKWDRRFLKLAREISTWSKDPSTQVGAVLVDPFNRVISVGYNGFPVGVPDDPEMLNEREVKLACTIHAEENALLFSSGKQVHGSILYVYPFMPCGPCAAKIVQAGVAEVVSLKCKDPDRFDRWRELFLMAEWVLGNAKPPVKLRLYNEDDLEESEMNQ